MQTLQSLLPSSLKTTKWYWESTHNNTEGNKVIFSSIALYQGDNYTVTTIVYTHACIKTYLHEVNFSMPVGDLELTLTV